MPSRHVNAKPLLNGLDRFVDLFQGWRLGAVDGGHDKSHEETFNDAAGKRQAGRRDGACEEGASLANVFVPKFGIFRDEIAHQLNALFILKNFDLNTLRTNVFFRPFERDVFADDNARNSVK